MWENRKCQSYRRRFHTVALLKCKVKRKPWTKYLHDNTKYSSYKREWAFKSKNSV